MDIINQYGKEIFSLFVTLLTWAINYFYRSRAKIKAAQPHSYSFLVNEPEYDADGNIINSTQIVNTNSFLVLNHGRETAHNVEITFNWKPQYLNLWPTRPYEEHTDSHNRYSVRFNSLSPNERIGIELLSVNRELPALLNVRSDQAMGKFVEMNTFEVVAPWKVRVSIILATIGLASSIYISLWLLQILIT